MRKPLSLADAINGAIAQSKALQGNFADQGVAHARLQQARNNMLPSLGIMANYTRISNNIQPFVISFPGVGEVALNPPILNQSYNKAELRQLVWGGGRVRRGIEAAKLNKEAVLMEAERYKLTAADSVTGTWYSLYLLDASEQIIRQNIKLLQDQYRDLVQQQKQGIVIENDALKLDLNISNLENNLIDIQAGRAINNFNMAEALADPLDTQYQVDTSSIASQLDTRPIGEYLAEALRSRPELKVLDLNIKSAVVGQKIVAANRMPTLSIGGTYDYNRPNQRVFPSGPAFTGTWSVAATLNFDLANLYTNKAKESESRYSVEKLSTAQQQLLQGVQMEVNANFQNYQRALDKIRVAQKSVEQSKENFRVEQNRLRYSAITATDFLIANSQLLQAQLQFKSAQANAELAHWRLIKSVGRIQ